MIAGGALLLFAGWTWLSAGWSDSPIRATTEFQRVALYAVALLFFGSFARRRGGLALMRPRNSARDHGGLRRGARDSSLSGRLHGRHGPLGGSARVPAGLLEWPRPAGGRGSRAECFTSPPTCWSRGSCGRLPRAASRSRRPRSTSRSPGEPPARSLGASSSTWPSAGPEERSPGCSRPDRPPARPPGGLRGRIFSAPRKTPPRRRPTRATAWPASSRSAAWGRFWPAHCLSSSTSGSPGSPFRQAFGGRSPAPASDVVLLGLCGAVILDAPERVSSSWDSFTQGEDGGDARTRFRSVTLSGREDHWDVAFSYFRQDRLKGEGRRHATKRSGSAPGRRTGLSRTRIRST